MSHEQLPSLLLFVIPCLFVVAIFFVMMLATGEGKTAGPPPEETALLTEIRELKKRLILERR
jgi:hypothetical protein